MRAARWLVVVAALACKGSKAPSEADSGSRDGNVDSTSTSEPDADIDADADTDVDTAPPEVEVDPLVAPAETDRYVFVPNTVRDTVTRLEVATMQVDTVAVGKGPEIVRTTPDHATAVVFDAGDDAVTLLDAETLATTAVPVRPNLNDLVISPDGAWAMLWHREDLETDDAFGTGLVSFNELSMVRIADGAHLPTAVGFNPRRIVFTPDGRLAVVVSDEYLATIDLTAAVPVPELIELAPGVIDPPTAEEVAISPAGDFAWVRPFGATEILLVDLATHAITPLDAGGNPTDLDLTPDGTQVVVVARASQELYVFDVADPFAPPAIVSVPGDTLYGSITLDPSGALGVLYTTAVLTERFAVWDRTTSGVVERTLVKPVAAMAINPTGRTLLVVHTVADGPDTEPLFQDEFAITLVDLATFRSNPLLLPAQPLMIASSQGGDRGYFIMKDQPYLEVLDFVSLLHTQYTLPSLPVYLGVLADPDSDDGDEPFAWVSQDHELGRISFFDPDDGSLDTLTGFELNAGIED